MPVKIKDPSSGSVYDMPWEGQDNPTSADIDYFLAKQKSGSNTGINLDTIKTYGKRFLFGPQSDPGQAQSSALREEQTRAGFDPNKLRGQVLGPGMGPNDISKGADWLANKIDPADSRSDRGTIRPFMAGAVQGASNIVQGGLDPRSVAIRPVPRIDPTKVAAMNDATKSIYNTAGIGNTPKLALPPAPPPAPNRFISGPAGVTKEGMSYPMDTGPINPAMGRPGQGTVLPQELGSINAIPANTAARTGTTFGRIPKLTTDTLQDTLGNLEAAKNSPMEIPNNRPDYNIGLPNAKPQLPSAEPRPLGQLSKYRGGGKPNEPAPNIGTNDIGKVGLPQDDETLRLANEGNSRQRFSGKPGISDFKTGEQKFNLGDKLVNQPELQAEFERWKSANEDPRNWGSGTPTKEPVNIKENKSPARATIDEATSKPNTLATQEATAADAHARLESKGMGISNNVPYRPIPSEAEPKIAIKQWADGSQAGATLRGKNMADRFKDLDNPELINKFESGDRTGRLKDVQTYFDTRWGQAKELGLLSEDQKRLNYLRHYFEQSSEEVQTKLKTFVSKNPQFAKEGRFPTYQAAEGAGLTPKYKSISEIVGAYETEFNRAVRNKELYDYLKSSGRLSKGAINDSMSSWQFKGDDSKEVAKLIKNVMSRSEGVLGAAADVGSMTKNIYLGGGVPYTKYNMHAWNILRNDISNSGPVSALKKFFSDPTGDRAVEWYKNLPPSEKDILADLTDRGWQGKPISDTGESVNLPQKLAEKTDNPVGKAVLKGAGKTLETSQNVFEKPLFEKALPALNAQRTLEAYHSLVQKGMATEDALKAASQIGNDFYGGVDKVLRSSTNKDLGRLAILAPDWLESQVTKAIHQWKGVGKVVTGTANEADKMYAKSLARSAMIPAIGPVAAITAGKSLLGNNRQKDIGAIPLGEVNGKTREFPTLTTANEELRTPIVAPIEMYRGNPAALKDILLKNRISTPLNTVIDLVRGEDRYGNPLSGADKYGKNISFGKAVGNYAKEATRPFQHQAVQGLVSWLKGDITAEEAAAQGLELPVAYSSPPKEKRNSLSGPRISLPKTMR